MDSNEIYLPSFRTVKSTKKYLKHLKKRAKGDICPLCRERKTIKKFKYWRIIENDFPYDKIAKIHQMIVPRRHISEDELNKKELDEFKKIKKKHIVKNYDYISEGMAKSIPNHFHLHLIVLNSAKVIK